MKPNIHTLYSAFNKYSHPAIKIDFIRLINNILTIHFEINKRIESSIENIILTTDDNYPKNNYKSYTQYGATHTPSDRFLSVNLNTCSLSLEKSIIAAVNISNRSIGLSDLLINHLTPSQRSQLLPEKTTQHISLIQSSTLYGKKPSTTKEVDTDRYQTTILKVK